MFKKHRWGGGIIDLRLGNGVLTSLWNDKWLGDTSLIVKFPLLFSLSLQQDASVREVGREIEGVMRFELTTLPIFTTGPF
jgi:hypothetical protein